MHLGNNGLFRAYELDAIMAAVGETRVVFVNVNVPREWEKPNNAMLESNVGRYANATLVDWHAESGGKRDYFVDDGVHVTGEGAAAYVKMIAIAVRP